MEEKTGIRPPSAAMLAGLPPDKQAQTMKRWRSPADQQKAIETGDKRDEGNIASHPTEAINMQPTLHSNTEQTNNEKTDVKRGWPLGGRSTTPIAAALPRSLARRIEQINSAEHLTDPQKERLIGDIATRYYTEKGPGDQALEILLVGGATAIIIVGTIATVTFLSRALSPAAMDSELA